MPLVNMDGGFFVPIGPSWQQGLSGSFPVVGNITLDATNEAVLMIGHCMTSDRGSHTINTTGSSSIGWRTAGVTFAQGGSTFTVGIAPVDTTAGPPARASNTADAINFDVAAAFTGGGGGITANAWQTSVPTTGTKTIAHGDLIAICMQFTTRVSADSIAVTDITANQLGRSVVNDFTAAAYGINNMLPNSIITFSDGALGWLQGAVPFTTTTVRTWNSGSANAEYGQLYKLPFPCRIYGLYGWVDSDADYDMVLYSTPLGTPVAEKTVSLDANTLPAAGRLMSVIFSSPYDATADQEIAAIFKPGGSNISTYFRTLASATHRIAYAGGTDSYGVARASGAFAAENSNMDMYDIGLIVGGFHDGTGSSGGGHILGGTIVR